MPVRESGGRPEVLLVHRPKYDDWSFPKGKAAPDETDEECALREVAEETGLECALGPPLPAISYSSRGRPKRARYWLMCPQSGRFVADHEVDAVEWMKMDEARGRLTYEHDRALLDVVERLL